MSESITDAIAASWSLPLWPTLALTLNGVVYWRGWLAARRTRSQELPGWRAACFTAGLASVWLAIASPLDALGGWLLLAHMAQHLVLMSVAPPLLLLGNPSVPLLRGLPRSWIRNALGPLLSERPLQAVFRFLTHPATAWIAMNAAYLGWHVPAAYELALRSDAWHQVEHACFLFTSLLFWWNVLQPWPAKSRWSRWAVVPYLITADLVNTVLSAFLVFSGRVLYPTYAAMPRLFGISAAQDQAAAGSFMWVAGSAIYWVPAIAITFRLLSQPKPALVTIGGGPARGMVTTSSQSFDLLRTPFIGPLLRARFGRQALQAASLVVVCVVMAHGFFGPRMAAMNLAGVLPWNFVRAVGVLALLFFGNLFCMVCPFTLPRELARRLGWAQLRWPRWLRAKWIGVALLLAFFFCYEHFSLWDYPARTAWLLAAYIGAAFAVDSLFQGASFCKYVCPIGQFNFVAALLSPTTLRVRIQAVCASCATHDCVRGNAVQRGCELELYLPQKHSNADCTLCMDCVKACPHDNIGILPRSLTEDLLRDGPTSSAGRLHRRIDIAGVAWAVVLGAFGSAAAMVAPGRNAWAWLESRVPVLSTGGGSAAGVLVVALLCTGVLWAVSTAGRERSTPLSEHFSRAAFALLPLAFGMWAAHLLFHLAVGVPSLPPLLQQVTHDFGSTRLGPPNWSAAGTSGVGNWLLQAQLMLLDAGLLLSLYCAWRMSAQTSRRLRAVVPVAALIVALYVLAFWLLLAPMQMRGMVAMGAM